MYDVFDDFDGDYDDAGFDDGGFDGADYDSDYEEDFFEENFNYDGDGDSLSSGDEHFAQEDQQQEEEPWISPIEAGIMGYGFAREECEEERRRLRELQRQERSCRNRDGEDEIF